MDGTPNTAKKTCCACASEIEASAQLCPTCKTQQSRRGRLLQGLTSNLALLVATASFAIWLVTNIPKMMSVLHPRVAFEVLSFRETSMTVANVGNRAAVVDGLNLGLDETPRGFAQSVYSWKYVPIDRSVNPDEILRYDLTGVLPPFRRGPHWNYVPRSTKHSAYAIAVAATQGDCANLEIHKDDDPELVKLVDSNLKQYGVPDPYILNVKGVLRFYPLSSSAKPWEEAINLKGLILLNEAVSEDSCFHNEP